MFIIFVKVLRQWVFIENHCKTCYIKSMIEFNLYKILEQKKLNMLQAARLCKLSYPTIYNMATGRSKMVSLETISKLCIGLKIKASDLFRVVK